MILSDFFKKHSKEIPNAEALIFKERHINYKEYDQETDRVAMGLLKLGAKRGDRIGIYIPLWPEAIYVMLGAAKIGAIACPISVRATAAELEFYLKDSEASVLFLASSFMGTDFLGNLESIRKNVPSLKHVVCLDQEKDGVLLYEKFLAKPDEDKLRKAMAQVEEDDSFIFIYTSGTTGVPKAAMLTHKNVIAMTDAQLEVFGGVDGGNAAQTDPNLLNIPIAHAGAAVMGVVGLLNAGAPLIMTDVFDPEQTLQLIDKYKVVSIGQVPVMYAMELYHPNLSKYDVSSIKNAVCSAQPCPSELITAFKQKLGITPRNAYGLTEVSGAITYTDFSLGEEKLTYSVGKPISIIKLVIKDDDGNILPQGEAGEICVKGPVVMKGYWKRPDEDAKVFDKDGFLHTGDMGRLDEDGWLTIVGRKKEMYIRGGENVYPPAIEEVICQHPDVMLAAVIGRPHEKWGEVGRAYIMAKPGTNPTPEGIKEFLKDKLSNYKLPEDVIIRPLLPLTPLGKVKKLDLYTEMRKELGK